MLTRASLIPRARAAVVTIDVGDGLHLSLDDRLIGSRVDDRDIRLRLTGSAVMHDLVAVRVRGQLGNEVIDQTYDPEPNLWFEAVWDGVGASGGRSYSTELEVGWEMRARFPRPGRTRWWKRKVVAGNLDLRALGLGGFTPTVVPHLDVDGNRLWRTDGSSITNAVTTQSAALAGIEVGEGEIAVPDGQRVHIFDEAGRFEGTLQSRKMRVVATAEHDAIGRICAFSNQGHEFLVEHRMSGTSDTPAEALIESPAEVWVRVEFDSRGRAVALTDHDRYTTRLSWDDSGLLSSITDPEGLVTEIERDQLGRVERLTDSTGRDVSLMANGTDGLDIITGEGRGRRLVRHPDHDGSDRHSDTDLSGLTTWIETHNGETTIHRPNGMVDFTAETTRANGDHAVSVRHQRSSAPSGRVLTSVRESSPTEERLTIVDRTWTRSFDDDFTTLTSQSPDGTTSTATLRPGRDLTLDDTSAGKLVVNFDKYQRPKRRTSRGIETNFGYDQYGRVAWTEVARRRRKVHHDERGRVTGLRTPEGWIRFVRSPAGWVELVETPSGARTRLARGADGRIEEITSPAVDGVHSRQQLAYDADGFVAGRRWMRDNTDRTIDVEYHRDSLGRLTSVIAEGTKLLARHDADTGQLVELMDDDHNRITWTWDGDMCWAEEVDGVVGARIERVFDEDQIVAVRTVNRAGAVNYQRDRTGLLLSAGPVVLERGTESRDLLALRLRGLTTFREVDEFGRLTKHETRMGRLAEVFFREEIERDDLGRIVSVREHAEGVDRHIEYEYDEVGRLIEATVDGERDVAIAWDANGNIIEVERQGRRMRFEVDASDRVVAMAGEPTVHDVAENLTGIGVNGSIRCYRFDGLNRLVETSDAHGRSSTHILDPLGRLVKLDAGPAGSLPLRIVWDGNVPAATLNEDSSIDIRFVHTGLSDTPEALVRDGIEYLIVRDHLGSVRCVIDSHQGQVVQAMTYDSLGRLLRDTNPGWQPFGFAGGLHDPTSGLVRIGQRVYDPILSRFLSPDPDGFKGGNLNRYQFRHGDPVNRLRPGPSAPADVSSPLGEVLVGEDPFLGRRPMPVDQIYLHSEAWRRAVDETAAMPDPVGDHIVRYDDSLAEVLDRWTLERDRVVPTFDRVWDPLDSCAGPGGFDYEPTSSGESEHRIKSFLGRVRKRPQLDELVKGAQADLGKILETIPD